MEWTKNEIIYLIAYYKQYPALYDVDHEYYKLKSKRNDCFCQIREKISILKSDITIQDIKQKIRNLRVQYTAEKKKIQKSIKSGASWDDIYKPKLWFFDQMGFLDNHTMVRDTRRTVEDPGKVNPTHSGELKEEDSQSESGIPHHSFYTVFINQESMNEPPIDAESINDPLASVAIKQEEMEDTITDTGPEDEDKKEGNDPANKEVLNCTDCEVCGKRFNKLFLLRRHMVLHTDYKCGECGRKFLKQRYLDRHMLTHTSEKTYNCELCSKSYRHKNSLRMHVVKHTGDKLFECTKCGKGFYDKQHLKSHSYSHAPEKPHECGVCGKRFSQNFTLTAHMMTHTGEKRFKCVECGRGFTRSCTLNAHMLLHAGKKPFRCRECNKGFTQAADLDAHVLTHSVEKPFECVRCGKGFMTEFYMKKHMLSHTGKKEFECNVCGKKFLQNCNYQVHLFTHIKEKNFQCKVCPKKFSGMPLLKAHVRRSHIRNSASEIS